MAPKCRVPKYSAVSSGNSARLPPNWNPTQQAANSSVQTCEPSSTSTSTSPACNSEISTSVCRGPSRCETEPQVIRPAALNRANSPSAPSASASDRPPSRMPKSLSEPITISPQLEANMNAGQSIQKLRVRMVSSCSKSAAIAAAAVGVGGCQPWGSQPAGGLRSSNAPAVITTAKIAA